jgi:DNA-3-methyladenine glycosylase I
MKCGIVFARSISLRLLSATPRIFPTSIPYSTTLPSNSYVVLLFHSINSRNSMTTKYRTRSLQSFKKGGHDDDDDKVDATTTTTTTATVTQVKPKKKVKTSPKASVGNIDAIITSNLSSDETPPWYTFYTKGDVEYETYMANEWGYEKYGDQSLFEMLSLEGAQAGLTWRTILHKREAYRTTFHNFDPIRVASMTSTDVDRILLNDETIKDTKQKRTVIVRNRGKVESVIHNAKLLLQMRDEQMREGVTSTIDVFSHFLWSFVDHKPILYSRTLGNYASTSEESIRMSTALKKYGFKFVGPTTCYSLMQASGMVVDHPHGTPEWNLAYQRLQARTGGYQERKF